MLLVLTSILVTLSDAWPTVETLSQADKDLIVQIHNDERLRLQNGLVPDVPTALNYVPLTWSSSLASAAAIEASRKTTDNSECLGTHSFAQPSGVGENLAFASSATSPIQALVSGWLSEQQCYSWGAYNTASDDPTCSDVGNCYDACGHYTAMIWEDTTEVGCALVRDCVAWFSSKLVCLYSPNGNVIGEYPYDCTATSNNDPATCSINSISASSLSNCVTVSGSFSSLNGEYTLKTGPVNGKEYYQGANAFVVWQGTKWALQPTTIGFSYYDSCMNNQLLPQDCVWSNGATVTVSSTCVTSPPIPTPQPTPRPTPRPTPVPTPLPTPVPLPTPPPVSTTTSSSSLLCMTITGGGSRSWMDAIYTETTQVLNGASVFEGPYDMYFHSGYNRWVVEDGIGSDSLFTYCLVDGFQSLPTGCTSWIGGDSVTQTSCPVPPQVPAGVAPCVTFSNAQGSNAWYINGDYDFDSVDVNNDETYYQSGRGFIYKGIVSGYTTYGLWQIGQVNGAIPSMAYCTLSTAATPLDCDGNWKEYSVDSNGDGYYIDNIGTVAACNALNNGNSEEVVEVIAKWSWFVLVIGIILFMTSVCLMIIAYRMVYGQGNRGKVEFDKNKNERRAELEDSTERGNTQMVTNA